MNADGHRKKAGEIEGSLNELLPDPEGRHVVAVVELTFGILLHWIAFGMEKKFGKHGYACRSATRAEEIG